TRRPESRCQPSAASTSAPVRRRARAGEAARGLVRSGPAPGATADAGGVDAAAVRAGAASAAVARKCLLLWVSTRNPSPAQAVAERITGPRRVVRVRHVHRKLPHRGDLTEEHPG